MDKYKDCWICNSRFYQQWLCGFRMFGLVFRFPTYPFKGKVAYSVHWMALAFLYNWLWLGLLVCISNVIHYSDVTWGQWCLGSLTYLSFVQQLVHGNSKNFFIKDPYYWPFVKGIHWPSVNSPQKQPVIFLPLAMTRFCINHEMVGKTGTGCLHWAVEYDTGYLIIPLWEFAEKISVWWIYLLVCVGVLTYWVRNKMADMLKATFCNPFSWKKTWAFRLKHYWNLFPKVKGMTWTNDDQFIDTSSRH